MRIALIGAAGQLGTDLQQVLHRAIPLRHEDVDISDAGSVQRVLDGVKPELVINAAAYNLVDRAEDEPEKAWAVNAHGPRNLARWCASHETTLLHVSTDYVFGQDEGRKHPYTEDDTPGPLGVYGESKLAGEQFVRQECPRHFIVRTCGLYGRSATRAKGNFVSTMLRLAGERDELRVVDDQHCTPTFTGDLALVLARLIATDAYGLYHATNAGETTWYGLACEIMRIRQISIPIIPIPSSEYPTRARRPLYSVLNCDRIWDVTESPIPDWRDALARHLG